MRPGSALRSRLCHAALLAALLLPALPVAAQHAPPGASRVEPRASRGEPRARADRCYRPFALRDRDIRRHAARIAGHGRLCITVQAGRDGPLSWRLTTIRHRDHPDGPVWAVLHDDEDAAFDTALAAVETWGGALVAVDTDEARTNDGLDPNRAFGDTVDQVRGCANLGGRPAAAYTRAILDHFPPGATILALHTNAPGHRATGGLGDVSAAVTDGARQGFLTRHPQGALSDPDNVVLIPGELPFAWNRAAQEAIRFFHARGINAIYETVRRDHSDCSLSQYATLVRGAPYYNIEVLDGRAADQLVIVRTLMDWMGIAPAR